jgi:transposase
MLHTPPIPAELWEQIPPHVRAVIPPNHLVFRVAKVVDLSFIYDLTKDLYCEDNGRPSVDPVLFFRMPLIEYLFGISVDQTLSPARRALSEDTCTGSITPDLWFLGKSQIVYS